MRYYLGLDNGGTTTKAALFNQKGEEVCVASTETRMLIPQPGFIERDMEEMWGANCQVIKRVIKSSGIDPKNIAGVAVCGHGKGLYLWGKNGRPARPGIISTDNRAYEYPLRWKENGVEPLAFKLSYQHILACQPVSLLAWLLDNEPEVTDNIEWIFECKDYIRFRLTGEAYGEITDYSGTSLINLYTGTYDDKLIGLFGLEKLRKALPPLRRSMDICGYVTGDAAAECGLTAGTPVAGGMFDIDACAVAVNVLSEKNICMIAGTWSINEYIRREPVVDGSILMNSLFCLPGYYLIEECSPTSAGNNEWFIKTFLQEAIKLERINGERIYDQINENVGRIPAQEFCPIFFPFLMASNVHPNAKGCFLGISNYHTRTHFLRGIYEGIAYSHKYHLEKLLRTTPAAPESIRLAGGVAHSKVWTQIFADVTGFPVETVKVNETGALGCAIAAAVAVGDYADIMEAADNMCSIAHAVEPISANISAYQEKYELYMKSIFALDAVWDDYRNLYERMVI